MKKLLKDYCRSLKTCSKSFIDLSDLCTAFLSVPAEEGQYFSDGKMGRERGSDQSRDLQRVHAADKRVFIFPADQIEHELIHSVSRHEIDRNRGEKDRGRSFTDPREPARERTDQERCQKYCSKL